MSTKYVEKKIGDKTIVALQHIIVSDEDALFDTPMAAYLSVIGRMEYGNDMPDVKYIRIASVWTSHGYEWNPRSPVRPLDFFDFTRAKIIEYDRVKSISARIVDLEEGGYAFIYLTDEDKYAVAYTHDAEYTYIPPPEEGEKYERMSKTAYESSGRMTFYNIARYLLTNDVSNII